MKIRYFLSLVVFASLSFAYTCANVRKSIMKEYGLTEKEIGCETNKSNEITTMYPLYFILIIK